MAHKHKPCCEPNTCVEIIPSKCVRYTGTPTDNSPIDKAFQCDPYLNDIIHLFDDNMKEMIERLGVNKNSLDAANSSCGLSLIDTTSLPIYEINETKYAQSEVVIQLLGVVCELQKELNFLKSGSVSVDSGNLYWEDLRLSENFKEWILYEGYANCLGNDPCDPTKQILTLGTLLKALIRKICDCCPPPTIQ
jgi:hypothetical protein